MKYKMIFIGCLALLCGCGDESDAATDGAPSGPSFMHEIEKPRRIALDSFGEAGERVRSFVRLADSLDTIPPNMGYAEWPDSAGGEPHFEFNFNAIENH